MDEKELPYEEPVTQDWQKKHDEREAVREQIRQRVRSATSHNEYFRPAKPKPTITDESDKVVAVYARVSTKSTDQTSSIENQTQYYTKKISDNPHWTMQEIYSDEGKSGTSLRHREEFMRMMENAQAQKMDLILCASVSRFARNISDCLEQISLLKTMHPSHPIGVFFETENIYTLDPNSDQSLHIHAMLADWESRNKSSRMILSYDQRILTGQYPVADLLGYRHTKNGELIIQPEEAKTVRFMFLAYLNGYGYAEIADILTEKQRPTLKGRTEWNSGMVRSIMSNERTWGDLEARKSVVIDYKKGIVVKNNGLRDSAYVPGHHEGIVTPEIAKAVKLMSASSRSLDSIPLFRVIRQGTLKGFISINPGWGGNDISTLTSACLSVYDDDEYDQMMHDAALISGEEHSNVLSMTLTGYQVPPGVFFLGKNTPSLTITDKGLRFNKACHDKLDNCKSIDILYHPFLQSIIITAGKDASTNSVSWINSDGKPQQLISAKVLSSAIYEQQDWIADYQFRFRGITKQRGDVKFIVFSLDEPQILLGKSKVDVPEENIHGSTRFIPYKAHAADPVITEDGKAYPAEWSAGHGFPYALRCRRDAVINSIRQEDVFAPSVIFENPSIASVPIADLQDEFEELLASM